MVKVSRGESAKMEVHRRLEGVDILHQEGRLLAAADGFVAIENENNFGG